MPQLVEKCVSIKREIVEKDERDNGLRKILNAGHTVGHANEKLSGYTMLHGEAVGIGMVYETKIAEQMGVCAQGLSDRSANLLLKNHLPIHTEYQWVDIVREMHGDKKNVSEKTTFELPLLPGQVQEYQYTDDELLALSM